MSQVPTEVFKTVSLSESASHGKFFTIKKTTSLLRKNFRNGTRRNATYIKSSSNKINT
jgi:hypothetical protein